MSNLQENCLSRLKKISDKNQFREIYSYNSVDSINLIHNGEKYISFCGNDYLGLSSNENVISAMNDSINNVAGASASRLVTGSNQKYRELEELISSMKSIEDCCVFGSGYLTNIGVIPALMNRYDLIISDKLVHACIIDGIKLSGAVHKRFKHNDLSDLEEILKKHRDKHSNCLIITETVFSMDGDLAHVNDISDIAKKYDCWTMTDDAHGFGVINIENKCDIQMGTLSKAAGTYGGYVCASKEVISLIKNTARSLIFSTALPENIINASIVSLNIMKDNPDLSVKVLENSRYFSQKLGLTSAESAIVPYIVNSEEKALEISAKLKKDGFLVSAIRPPTVAEGSSRLRFTFSSLHNKDIIDQLVTSMERIIAK